MTQALILFTEDSIQKGTARPDDLARLLHEATSDLQVEIATYDQLLFMMSNAGAEVKVTHLNKSLDDYDVIYMRRINENASQAMAVGKYCVARGIPVMDEEIANRVGSMSKLTQYMQFALNGVPIPKTLYSCNNEVLLDALRDGIFNFPLIMKSVVGSRGSDNYLVASIEEAQRICAEHANVTFVAQQFIANTADYRVWVCGEEIGPILRRSRQEGHKNNTSQGGDAVLLENKTDLPQRVLDECVRSSQLLQRNVAGVDVIFENDDLDGEYYFLEVNRAPQIEGTPYEDVKAQALSGYLQRLAQSRR